MSVGRSLNVPPDQRALSVSYRTTGSGRFTPVSGTLAFGANEDSKTFTVQTRASNTGWEPNWRVGVRLNYRFNGEDKTVNGQGTVTDGPPKPTLTITPPPGDKVIEGQTATFNLTLNHPLDYTLNVTANFSDSFLTAAVNDNRPAEAGGATMKDVGAITVVSIPARQLTGSVSVATVDDSRVEPDEHFRIRINNGSGNRSLRGTVEYTVTIEDNDTSTSQRYVYLSSSSGFTRARIWEATSGGGKENLTINVMLAGPPPDSDVSIPLAMEYATATGATAADIDIPASVSILAGKKSGTVTLSPVRDGNDERFNEAFLVKVGNNLPAGYTKGDRSQFVLVVQDRDRTGVSLQNLSPTAISENGKSATFKVRLSRPIDRAVPRNSLPAWLGTYGSYNEGPMAKVTFIYGGTATRGKDFDAVKSVTIRGRNAGSCTRQECTVTVTSRDNNYYEGNKSLSISILSILDTNNPSDLSATGIAHLGEPLTVTGKGLSPLTIQEDDAAPSFSIADAKATEGGKIAFTVTREGAPPPPPAKLTVQANTAPDEAKDAYPATAADDYTAVTKAQTLEFGENDETKTFEVQTTQDTVDEHDETQGGAVGAHPRRALGHGGDGDGDD